MDIFAEIAKYGAPGLIIVVLLYAVRHLYNEMRDSEKKRIEEAIAQIKVTERAADALEKLETVVKASLEARRARE